MKKHYVLDTNVLLYSPQAIFAFSEHTVISPAVVLAELDKFKSAASGRCARSRQVSRIIDELRPQGADDNDAIHSARPATAAPCTSTSLTAGPLSRWLRHRPSSGLGNLENQLFMVSRVPFVKCCLTSGFYHYEHVFIAANFPQPQ